jgi:hypothetical protein
LRMNCKWSWINSLGFRAAYNGALLPSLLLLYSVSVQTYKLDAECVAWITCRATVRVDSNMLAQAGSPWLGGQVVDSVH